VFFDLANGWSRIEASILGPGAFVEGEKESRSQRRQAK